METPKTQKPTTATARRPIRNPLIHAIRPPQAETRGELRFDSSINTHVHTFSRSHVRTFPRPHRHQAIAAGLIRIYGPSAN